MREKTRKEIISDLIKELSENYSLQESTVIEQLCSSLSEVLSEKLTYRVETFFRNGELFFIGRTLKHSQEADITLSVSKLKYGDFQKACLILMKKLDIEEYSQHYAKYGAMVNKVVFGLVERILDDSIIVSIEGVNIQGKCNLSEMRITKHEDIINKRFAFHIINVDEERLGKRFRFIFTLSRNAKQTPAMLIKELSKDDGLIIKSSRRKPGQVSYLKSNKPIKKKILQAAIDEFGEAIRIRPISGEVSNGKS